MGSLHIEATCEIERAELSKDGKTFSGIWHNQAVAWFGLGQVTISGYAQRLPKGLSFESRRVSWSRQPEQSLNQSGTILHTSP
jgi:hypothetical protein